jgi:hypothetical protein
MQTGIKKHQKDIESSSNMLGFCEIMHIMNVTAVHPEGIRVVGLSRLGQGGQRVTVIQ